MIASRFAAQLLCGRAAQSVEDAVTRILAVQAQDPRGARLAVRARSSGLTAADVDHALGSRRSVVLTWLNRGTLHLVMTEDYWWLQGLTTPQLRSGNARRLEQEGVSPRDADRGVELVDQALAESGPQTRGQLRSRLELAGIPVAGQALVHILMLSALRGLTVRGPMLGREQAFVRVADWLERPAHLPERDQALALMVRRYLLGHSPAADRDLAKWAGLPLRDVRAGMHAIHDEVEVLSGGLVRHVDAPVSEDVPAPRLLGSFDPLLHGWVSREPVLGDRQGVVTSNGIFRPFALVDGRAVATWTLRAGQVVLQPFVELAESVDQALRADAVEVLSFLRPSTSPDEPRRALTSPDGPSRLVALPVRA